jgi:SAM-dependent methyltransferase
MSIRNNLHTDHGLETYAQGMCNSAGDKARINHYLVPGTILELGCGNGAYLQTLPEDRLKQTTAVDMNALLLLKAQANLRDKARLVTFKRANVLRDDFLEEFDSTQYDNVVLCSVLHELYSEARTQSLGIRHDEQIAEVEARQVITSLLSSIWDLLKVGGRLIIRDGCKAPNDDVTIRFKNAEVRQAFAKFVDDHPWFITYTELDYGVTLSMPDAYEFLTKYFYTENWNVEVLERFGWCNYNDIIQMLGDRELQTIEVTSYLIPWLGSKWEQDFELSDRYPHSTMLVAIQKIG